MLIILEVVFNLRTVNTSGSVNLLGSQFHSVLNGNSISCSRSG